ncbi:MAG: PKD domain-containing protein [Planctomycetes bacterium]|nr:PKD domain-containing protein [Planctomycetota bacterium]
MTVEFDASASRDPEGRLAAIRWEFGDGATAEGVHATHTFDRIGVYTVTLTVEDTEGASSVASLGIIVRDSSLPPDPSEIAPPLPRGVLSAFGELVEFLYAGPEPIQEGVAPGTIEPRRAAVLRGQVLDADMAVLSGVVVSILDHPEFGQTLSRIDGMFDLAVNGGSQLTVNYQKGGYLTVQRQADASWQDFAFLPDVVMIPLDNMVTPVDLRIPSMQVALGSLITDADGTRQAALLFPAGTSAQLVMPDGTTRPASSLSVRATAYTVGDNGPSAMPAFR